MRASCIPVRFRCPALALGLAWGALAAPLAAEDGSAADRSSITVWIAQLDHADYDTRARATEKLIAAGRAAVDPLVEAAETGSPEVVSRAIAALEAIYRGDDLEASSAAEEALDRLAVTRKRFVASRANEVLAANQEMRRERALAQIRRLGGIIELFPTSEQAGNAFFPEESRTISHVILGRAWTGGDEGLKYLQRIPDLPALYLTKGPGFSPISEEAEKELQRSMPQLKIQIRGLAFLGIQGGQNFPEGCLVSGVTTGEAADKAGIRPGDMVLEFDGKPVPDFQTLIDLIMEKQPGDNVPVVVRRNGREINLTVVLGTWPEGPARVIGNVPRPTP